MNFFVYIIITIIASSHRLHGLFAFSGSISYLLLQMSVLMAALFNIQKCKYDTVF